MLSHHYIHGDAIQWVVRKDTRDIAVRRDSVTNSQKKAEVQGKERGWGEGPSEEFQLIAER